MMGVGAGAGAGAGAGGGGAQALSPEQQQPCYHATNSQPVIKA